MGLNTIFKRGILTRDMGFLFCIIKSMLLHRLRDMISVFPTLEGKEMGTLIFLKLGFMILPSTVRKDSS